MVQRRLFPPPVEAIVINAHFVPGEGWTLFIALRNQGEPWLDSLRSQYSRLTTAELIDTLCADGLRRFTVC